MNVLMIGNVPRETQTMIAAVFPKDWRIHFTLPRDAEPFLSEAEALIPEHVRVAARFLDGAPKLCMIQTGAGYDNIGTAFASAMRRASTLRRLPSTRWRSFCAGIKISHSLTAL